MSYWKKSNIRGVIPNNKSEALDLRSDCEKKFDDFEESITSDDLAIINTHDSLQDNFKNEDIAKSELNDKPGKRNPKCARCANHEKEPVPVKGHKRKCKYKECVCSLCNLTVERRELMAKTIREKRKQKEDLADNSYVYSDPVFKKQRTDESSSEADRESGYGTEENEKSKPNEDDHNEELKKYNNEMVHIIWNQLLDNKLPTINTMSELGQTILSLFLLNLSNGKQKLNSNAIINQILDASKHMKFFQMSKTPFISQMAPMPMTPLTPTTPLMTPWLSPPSSVSSIGSSDSPNDSIKSDSNLLSRNYPFIHPLAYLGAKPHPWFVPPPSLASVPNHRLLDFKH